LARAAPDFTLTNQFGRPESLHALHGRVVILAFIDPLCTNVCPLATTTMVAAKRLLGVAGQHVALIGVDANPTATSVRSVHAYTQAHGMLHQWQFLTGSLTELESVWRDYHIAVKTENGQIDDTPEIYVVNGRGTLAEIYQSPLAYASVGPPAQIIASEVSRLLPGHPRLKSALSYNQIASIGPGDDVLLPRAGGGTVRLGPDGAPRLYVFFASWLTERMNLAGQLNALRAYQTTAAARGLPRVTAVDEGTVEPSARSLRRFLRTVHGPPLPYPLAIDNSGRVADGYLVQDQPWFVLASRAGNILWYWDGSTQGRLTAPELEEHVSAALTGTPSVTPPTISEVEHILAGSPQPLAGLHEEAGKLLGSEKALLSRVRALRGYPIVINAWASWCTACEQEYPLFADASVRYGRRVAFLGVDALDSGPGAAREFLDTHPLSYPSYQSPNGVLTGLAPLIGLPTTIYIDRAGRIVGVVPGQYDSQGSLDGDIQHYLGL
jgi:cytochrome oxidase Cu insertion factor (SCO1/SenC/PrrC family)/thiol-disulfide isomerase/thioredoxin